MLRRRMLSVLLYVLFALRHPMPEHSGRLRQRWLAVCQSGHALCHQCFGTAADLTAQCEALIAMLDIPYTVSSVLDLLAINARSAVQRCRYDGRPAYVKLAAPVTAELTLALLGAGTASELHDRLVRYYADNQRPDGLQIRPAAAVERFLRTFAPKIGGNSVVPLVLLSTDAERLLLATMRPLGFAVPGLLGHAGLVAVVEDAGRRLAEFYGREFGVRAPIARQLLLAGIRFTVGVEGFRYGGKHEVVHGFDLTACVSRFYLTDVTADNVVVSIEDDEQMRVAFVDLDSVIVVDSSALPASSPAPVHRHEPIACSGCFAYDPETVAGHRTSDFNLYAICGVSAGDVSEWVTIVFGL